MKTISNSKRGYPKPIKYAMYLVLVAALGLLNWITTYANDSDMEERSLETRLAEALVPAPDPEPALEDWILRLSDYAETDKNKQETNLEDRLKEALKPVPDPEPQLERWLITFSDDVLGE
jgi:hypothetical protein